MTIRQHILLVSFLLALLMGCQPPADTSTPAPAPASAETITFMASNWSFFVGNAGNQGNPNTYQSTKTTATTPASYSLSISAGTIQDTSSYSYWVSGFVPRAQLQVGRTLTLKASVRLENVVGKGVSLALRGDTGQQTGVLFETTEDKQPIRGTAEFTDYSVSLPYQQRVEAIQVYLVLLDQTTGRVTFRDVSVVAN